MDECAGRRTPPGEGHRATGGCTSRLRRIVAESDRRHLRRGLRHLCGDRPGARPALQLHLRRRHQPRRQRQLRHLQQGPPPLRRRVRVEPAAEPARPAPPPPQGPVARAARPRGGRDPGLVRLHGGDRVRDPGDRARPGRLAPVDRRAHARRRVPPDDRPVRRQRAERALLPLLHDLGGATTHALDPHGAGQRSRRGGHRPRARLPDQIRVTGRGARRGAARPGGLALAAPARGHPEAGALSSGALDSVIVGFPLALSFVLWTFSSWLITGNALAQFSSQYGNSTIVKATNGLGVGRRLWWGQRVRRRRDRADLPRRPLLEPLLFTIVIVAVVLAAWWRDAEASRRSCSTGRPSPSRR